MFKNADLVTAGRMAASLAAQLLLLPSFEAENGKPMDKEGVALHTHGIHRLANGLFRAMEALTPGIDNAFQFYVDEKGVSEGQLRRTIQNVLGDDLHPDALLSDSATPLPRLHDLAIQTAFTYPERADNAQIAILRYCKRQLDKTGAYRFTAED